MSDRHTIASIDDLRTLYAAPGERALRKQLAKLDVHCLRFIELSPFVVLSSCGADGLPDASPRGGDPGFVEALGDSRLLIPDAPGNNRLDTLQNIVETGRIGLLFLIPGVDETLRVNGRARLSARDDWLDRMTTERRRPKLVIEVEGLEAYLHCAKALMRSKLWHGDSRIERSALPTMGQMLRDQTNSEVPAESQQAMLERYAADL
ncbi:MAG TPA: pyridoxamine 5'-phosphate oxidase family protein [Burkholderiaceae bacterium]|nr:pyridoxamine 5'-phosphate oxidase family protein [Burkholderiaceae bacterium]